MSILFHSAIPDLILNNIKRYFSVTKTKSGRDQISFWNVSLKDILIKTKLLDESECFISDDIRFKVYGTPICVNNEMLAYTITINVQNSVDIEFIFKPYDVEILVKDFTYWKACYFHSHQHLHDNGIIYYDVSSAIIPYMIYGQCIYDLECGSEFRLMQYYQKGEQNFKNLLLLKDMANI